MARPFLSAASLAAAALLSAGCGSQGVNVARSSPQHTGAVLFAERCGACHTLGVAGTQGSSTNVRDKETVDGPNFDTRKESAPDVIYAIENGGFSGAIMPENIVTGEQKRQIADFLSKNAGTNVKAQKPTGGVGKGGTNTPVTGGDQPSGGG
jgi:mono/diheme cytochrome c family protein